jgi:hypothetical protein
MIAREPRTLRAKGLQSWGGTTATSRRSARTSASCALRADLDQRRRRDVGGRPHQEPRRPRQADALRPSGESLRHRASDRCRRGQGGRVQVGRLARSEERVSPSANMGRQDNNGVPHSRDDRSLSNQSAPARRDGRPERPDRLPHDVNRGATRPLGRPERTEGLPTNTERLPRSESRVPARAFFLSPRAERGPRYWKRGEMLSPRGARRGSGGCRESSGRSSMIERGKMLSPAVRDGGRGGAARGEGGSSNGERGKMLLPGLPDHTESGSRRDERPPHLTAST